ncbi:DUF4190 domain-containing protein [Actinacidiphila glaucinigra]|uniref:DUF4190 domain-containing protein n=1 Tax=Actinacidiphila glaucinigra TaxID=235986 RepID=UPI0035DC1621
MDSPNPPSFAPPSAPARPPLNRLAVAALVSGLLLGLPLLGVVLGAMALTRIDKRGERGKGMATTGLVLSSLSTLVCAVTLALSAYQLPKGLGEEAAGAAPYSDDYFSLRKGDCIDTGNDELAYAFLEFSFVSCEGRHTAEVYAVFEIADRYDFPGDDAVSEKADSRCWDLSNTYAMDSWALPAGVEVTYYAPSKESWADGDRQVTCLFYRDPAGPLKGSVRRDETMLDEHQVAYLKAANVINDARFGLKPEADYVKDDFTGYRQWAHDVAVALDEQARILRGHQWPAGAQPHVAALQTEIDAARPHWANAADAKDVGTFYDHYEAALHRPGHEQAIKAREALKLTTSDDMPESVV